MTWCCCYFFDVFKSIQKSRFIHPSKLCFYYLLHKTDKNVSKTTLFFLPLNASIVEEEPLSKLMSFLNYISIWCLLFIQATSVPWAYIIVFADYLKSFVGGFGIHSGTVWKRCLHLYPGNIRISRKYILTDYV